MKIKDLETALPYYNKLHELKREIRLLNAFQENIRDFDVLCVELHNKGTGSVKIEEIGGVFKTSLIQSVKNFKIEQLKSVESALERI
ncbi:MAG: hypothetical protein IH950_16280 [Bacteroidetes bacterium]|nr:hypothetical protein [Bacteroidota bacterium]